MPLVLAEVTPTFMNTIFHILEAVGSTRESITASRDGPAAAAAAVA